MPYEIETRDGIVLRGIPDDVPRDAPELKQRVQQARTQRHIDSPEFKTQVAADRDRMMKANVDDMSMPERWAANWSAGYGNLAQGIDQLLGKVGIGPGVSDEDIAEKRERDKYLARNWGDKVMQVTSEVLPTMALPMGAYGRAVEALPGIAQAGPMTRLLTAGAAGGAGSAALSPVKSDESRAANMTMAGVFGAAIPGGGAAVPGAWRGAKKYLTESGATQRAIETITENMPERIRREVLDKLAARQRPTLKGQPVDVPTSAAQATGDARLAQAEAFSRSKPSTQPDWADFDTARNAALFDTVEGMAPSERVLERAARMRSSKTGPMREQAFAAAADAPELAGPVVQKAQRLLESADPDIQRVGRYVLKEFGDDATSAVSPQRLYEARKFLTAKLSGPSAIGDELAASAKAAKAETTALVAEIDAALDKASKGQWSPYLAEFSQRSKPITSGRASRDVLEKIEQKPLRGNTPEVTASGYGTALRQSTGGKYGDKLTDPARADADAFLDHLRQAESASRTRKSAATMGGGSITNSDQQLAALTSKFIEALPMVGGYAKRITEHNVGSVERAMARLLQSPDELGAALRALPPDQRQRVLDEALRATGAAGAASVTP